MARGKYTRAKTKQSGKQVPARHDARSQPVSTDRGLVAVERFEQRFEQFSGPLPHPELLRGYEDLVPGSADRIIHMAEVQAKHRQDLERTVIKGGSRRSWAGLGAGLIVALAFGYWSYDLILHSHEVAGSILGTLDLGSLVGVFVYGRRDQRQEREAKAEELANRR